MNPPAAFLALNPEISLSAGHERMVVFARRRDGTLAHIDAVANGKACDCTCLACDEPLIARQGDVRGHSFAHPSGTQCDHAMEAMLHAVAAELLRQRGRFVVPPLQVTASVTGPWGQRSRSAERPAVQVPVDSVALDKRPPWRRPVIVAMVKGRPLLIHIALDHPSGDKHRQTLAELDQAAVEIDLHPHGLRTLGELERLLFTADHRKHWVFNHRADALRDELAAQLKAQAEAQWLAQQQALQALAEQRARERAERAEHAEHARLQQVAIWQAELARMQRLREEAEQAAPPPPAPVRHPRPAEGSPTIEYTTPEGRIWLLHSTRPDIHFKAEAGVAHALQVLLRLGAVEEVDTPGVYRIPAEGWAAAAIELAGAWLGVRSVTGVVVVGEGGAVGPGVEGD